MINNWPVKKLGEVTDVFSGVWGPQDNAGTAVLRSTNFNNDGTIAWNEVAYHSIPENKVNQLALNQGDILVEKSGGSPAQPVGRVVYFDAEQQGKVVFGNFISKLQVNDKEIEPKFLFYYLLYFYKTGGINRYQSQTTGIRNLQLKDYLGIEIPKFRTEVQKKIVERLDAIRKAQELCDQQIKKTEELFDSLFNESSKKDWPKISLGLVVEINPSKSEVNDLSGDLDVSFLAMADVSENAEIIKQKVRKLKDVRTGFTFFRNDDVLLAKITPCFENGKGALAKDLKNNVGFGSTEFHVLRAKSKINSKFLYYLTIDKQFRKAGEYSMTGSAGQQRVPKEYLENISVKLPPLEEQQKIVEKLEAVQNYKKLLLKQKSFLKELFDSVLDKSMKGELD